MCISFHTKKPQTVFWKYRGFYFKLKAYIKIGIFKIDQTNQVNKFKLQRKMKFHNSCRFQSLPLSHYNQIYNSPLFSHCFFSPLFRSWLLTLIYCSCLSNFSSLMLALQLLHTVGQLLYRCFQVFHLLSQGLNLLRDRQTDTDRVMMWWRMFDYTYIIELVNTFCCLGCSRWTKFQANNKIVGGFSGAIKMVTCSIQ